MTENKKTFYELMSEKVSIPFVYQAHEEVPSIPFISYIGTGQDRVLADNTIYHSNNTYKLEYYYKIKNEEIERELEQAILELGYIYTKSEDVYIYSENLFVIYYYLWQKEKLNQRN